MERDIMQDEEALLVDLRKAEDRDDPDNTKIAHPKGLIPIIASAIVLLAVLFMFDTREESAGLMKTAPPLTFPPPVLALRQEAAEDATKMVEASSLLPASASLPSPSVPPNYELNPLKRMVVAAHYKEDTGWMNQLSELSTITIMGPAGLPANKGGEAMAYLTYIIDNYEHLPESMLFIHAHESGWHTEGPQLMRIMGIPCWNQVEYATITTFPYMDFPFVMKGIIPPALEEQHQLTYNAWKVDPNFEELFNMTMPDRFLAPCCAQFLVHRRKILARPKAVYEKIQKWLIGSPAKSFYTGRVMEFTWHILFGDPPETKPLNVVALARKCPKEGNELNSIEEEASPSDLERGGRGYRRNLKDEEKEKVGILLYEVGEEE